MAFSGTDILSLGNTLTRRLKGLDKSKLSDAKDDIFIAYENPLSYGNILDLRESYRKAGSWAEKDNFNLFDIPSHKYFKILFYFDDTSENGTGHQGGLLAPTWELNPSMDDLYYHNSAYSYLKINGEDERAENLKQFVTLLSNINAHSPWYFQSITGLDTALERKAPVEKDFKIDEERKMISIKCLADSFDNRIGNLLDLYRSIVWSWATKREIVPSNLRKFDMAIYLYESPLYGFHDYNGDFASIDKSSSGYITSYKYIEFHNCEFDYNSSKSGYENITNVEGISQEYTINIYYDDCYENRYNEFICKDIGDLIALDTMLYIVDAGGIVGIPNISKKMDDHSDKNILFSTSKDTLEKAYANDKVTKLNDRINSLRTTENIASKTVGEVIGKKLADGLERAVKTAAGEVVGLAVNAGKSLIKKAVFGNLNSFSLTRGIDNVDALLKGQVVGAVSNAVQDSKGTESLKIGATDYELGNIFKKKINRDRARTIQAQTLANNI